MDITWLGHSCFLLEEGEARVLVDPFLTGNPKAAREAGDVDPTHILLTHGHADHIGDTVDIAKRTGAPVVAIVELARSEEHTSELQSRQYLVCRLLLEKKNTGYDGLRRSRCSR